VPKLLAISRIVADPAAYGLRFEPVPNQPYFGIVDRESRCTSARRPTSRHHPR